MGIYTSLSTDSFHNCALMDRRSDLGIYTKSESGDHAWFVNNKYIVNIEIFRI